MACAHSKEKICWVLGFFSLSYTSWRRWNRRGIVFGYRANDNRRFVGRTPFAICGDYKKAFVLQIYGCNSKSSSYVLLFCNSRYASVRNLNMHFACVCAIAVGSGLGFAVGSEVSSLTGDWRWGIR